MKPATQIGVILFALVALAHLLRLLFGVEITVGGWTAPMWVSVLGVLVPGAVAFLIVKEHK